MVLGLSQINGGPEKKDTLYIMSGRSTNIRFIQAHQVHPCTIHVKYIQYLSQLDLGVNVVSHIAKFLLHHPEHQCQIRMLANSEVASGLADSRIRYPRG